MIVCFEGIDGSGKSTQAKELVTALNMECVFNNKRPVAAYFSITDYAKRVVKDKNPEVLSDAEYGSIFNKLTVKKLIDKERIIMVCEQIDRVLKLLKQNNENNRGLQRHLFDQLATYYLELARRLFKVFSTYDNQNYVIVLDRWLWSTIAYNAANEGCVFKELLSSGSNQVSINILEDLIYKIHKPNLIFYLDVNPIQAEVARLQRGETDTVLENKDYQNRVKLNYDLILNNRLAYDNSTAYTIYPNVIHTINVDNRTIADIHKEVIEVFKLNRI